MTIGSNPDHPKFQTRLAQLRSGMPKAAKGMSKADFKKKLAELIEQANLADSGGSLPAAYASQRGVFGHLAKAMEIVSPGAVDKWGEQGEW